MHHIQGKKLHLLSVERLAKDKWRFWMDKYIRKRLWFYVDNNHTYIYNINYWPPVFIIYKYMLGKFVDIRR